MPMRSGQKTGVSCALVFSAAVFTQAHQARANINLELRATYPSTFIGSPFSVDLYAVSDDMSNQTLAAAQVIITWDTAVVQLTGLDNTGTPMIASFFGPEPYGLNTSLTDGDAMWIGLGPPGNPVAATPAGTFLTSFDFHCTAAPTDLGGMFPGTTIIDIAESGGMNASGQPGHTIVYHGTIPNTDVTGTLTGTQVQVLVPGPGGVGMLLGGILALRRGLGRKRRHM